jgi:hypothetical protein
MFLRLFILLLHLQSYHNPFQTSKATSFFRAFSFSQNLPRVDIPVPLPALNPIPRHIGIIVTSLFTRKTKLSTVMKDKSGWDGKLRVDRRAVVVNPEAVEDPDYSDEDAPPPEVVEADEGTDDGILFLFPLITFSSSSSSSLLLLL